MINNQVLVSVVIPFYNTPPRFMREAIESIFHQTYQTLEILLIDDGSGPESATVAQDYAEKFPTQVRIYRHPGRHNRGPYASRYLGIQKAQGEFIAFLDADDVWLPDKLEEQVALLQEFTEVAMLYGKSLYWYSWTGRESDLNRDFLPKIGLQLEGVIQPPRLLPLYLLGKTVVPCPSSLLIRRRALETILGPEDTFAGVYEDQVFYTKISLEAPIYVSSKCWDKYRQHVYSVSAVTERSGQNRALREGYLEWLDDYLKKKEVRDLEVWQALRRALWLNKEHEFPLLSEQGKKAIHRSKKWLLKFEEWFLPAPISRWIWVREFKPE